MDTTATKEFFAPLERRMRKEAIKYAVQKQMFCPITKAILDYRTCIEIDVRDQAGKLVTTTVVSPSQDLELDRAAENIRKVFPDYVVKFSTLNNKLTNPLLTKIK